MKSMTGYGSGSFKNECYSVEIEIKSYNNRYLEINHNIHPMLSSYENYVDNEIKKIASRGHLDLFIRFKAYRHEGTVALDESLLLKYKDAFSSISRLTGSGESTLSDYINMEGVLSDSFTSDPETYREGVEKALNDALSMLSMSKERDGEGTKEDLKRLGEKFRSSLAVVLGKKEEMEEYFKSVLLEKYEELLGEKGKDDPRFLSEVAALLVKYSINEECSRLKVHLDEYDRLLESEEPVGKRLDFLCQEMNREINTTASKSQMVEVNLEVVKMKDVLEDIREQARNIE